MTTLQTHGGGAQPASIDTSGKVTGGAALRVYGFDSEADAVAAGYVCEGGPAMSVALITDAQIASGAWRLEGDPSGTAVYTAPSNMPVEGGYAVPVYPVNGWGSAPAPVPPLFSSAEVGTVNASTVAVTFDQDVSAAGSDYSSGVTIKVNGSTRAFESGIRQANHAIVYYALSSAVVFGDTVTWEYSQSAGAIVAEDDSTPLEDVSAQSVTNNVPSIGDTLRADALAYWKLDEAAGNPRLDSTDHHWNLAETDGQISSVAGKVGNAIRIVDNGDIPPDLRNGTFTADFSGGITYTCWAKFNQYAEDGFFDLLILKHPEATDIDVWVGPKSQANTDMVFREGGGQPDQWTAAQSLNTWHFLAYWRTSIGATKAYLQADGGAVVEVTADAGTTPASMIVASCAFLGNSDELSLDEAGLWSRVLTTDELAYLYNSGAGRALFPAP